MDILECIEGLQDEALRARARRALFVVSRTFHLFGVQATAFSFNGGKDSTLLMHLIRAALAERADSQRPPCVYFEHDHEFPEVLDFIKASDQRWGLQLQSVGEGIKPALESLTRDRGIKAVLMGTRSDDPDGAQSTFSLSSEGWPAFMRVNPILDWSYHDVWRFLRAASVPYCSLYDQGYTSLGTTTNTIRNSALLRPDGSHAPAHSLVDERLERCGRLPGAGTAREGDGPTGAAPHSDTPQAALVIIGDELLSGGVQDVNGGFLSGALRGLGWRVGRMVVLPDDVTAIAAELSRLLREERLEAIITTGGVGPTPDDVTMAAVASALGEPLVRHPQLEASLRAHLGPVCGEAHLKMADTPGTTCELIPYDTPDGTRCEAFPLLRCGKVYVLPGVPSLVRAKFGALRERLRQREGVSLFGSHRVRLSVSDETQIASALQDVDSMCGGAVSVGSYPLTGAADGAGIEVVLSGKDEIMLELALQMLRARIGQWVM